MRVVVLVDGEHYPPVVRSAIGRIRARGDDVAAAVFAGGWEKIRPEDFAAAYGVEVERGDDPMETLRVTLAEHRPDAVIDLSDEPVMSPAARFRLASLTLAAGAVYAGPDFELRPPRFHQVLTKPSIRVVATGKRTGKTAVAGALARQALSRGRCPLIVAMGRGGPEDPHVIEAGAALNPADLLALADSGLHASSDYLEDSVTSGVTTIGCRRVAGGLAGGVFASNVVEGARLAESRPEDLVVLEGSGAAFPPVAAGAGLVCVPAHASPEVVTHYLGPYRLLMSDLAVVTMAEEENPTSRVESAIREISPSIEVVRTVFRPKPLTDVTGRRVFYCTTSPPHSGALLKRHLEETYGCEVVDMSHALADRRTLAGQLAVAPPYDVLLTEVKAAAVDVAVRRALADGRAVGFADNEAVGEGVTEAFDRLIALADARA